MKQLAAMMPKESIRGRIRQFLERHAHLLGDNVLEVGSRIHDPSAWYIDNRDLCAPGGKWTGIDMQPGEGVDFVADIECLEKGMFRPGEFSGVLCSEVLEHVRRPWLAIPEMFRVLRPGGAILVTIPFAFHIHAYPHDYFRYTPECIRLMLEDAGFERVRVETGGEAVYTICNH